MTVNELLTRMARAQEGLLVVTGVWVSFFLALLVLG